MAKLHEVAIHRLRPTQITVGMIEVHDKRAKLEGMKKSEQRDFMAAHPIPAVWGPDEKLYITDHHHLGRAASEAGLDTGFFLVEDDFSNLTLAQFWPRMNAAQWVHPIDQKGERRAFDDIPDHLEKLVDDPYRSLAGYVRDAGGYDKTPTAFAEFVWADFFRPRVRIGPTRPQFHVSVETGLKLASSPEAAHLPGYKGTATAAVATGGAAQERPTANKPSAATPPATAKPAPTAPAPPAPKAAPTAGTKVPKAAPSKS